VSGLADIAGELGWHAWQASVAGLIALGLAALLRRRAPRAAALVVTLALLKFIVPPFIRVPIAFGDTAAMLLNPFTFVPSGQETPAITQALIAAIAAAFLGVAALAAARVTVHLMQVARIRREATPAGATTSAALKRVSERLGLRIAPILLMSDEAEGPFATGVWRPAVIIPRALAGELDARMLDAVLAHELLHHRRRDLPMAWCAAAATSIFWFSPVVWRLARRLSELREECCDADVVRYGFATPRDYAETLLAAAAMPSGAAALAMRDGHPLGRRLRLVLEPRVPMPRALSAAIVALFAILCLPATPFASPWAPNDGLVRVERIVIR
jgi:beta-lactamase regulating signal transducer with metallopeptidase domain